MPALTGFVNEEKIFGKILGFGYNNCVTLLETMVCELFNDNCCFSTYSLGLSLSPNSLGLPSTGSILMPARV